VSSIWELPGAVSLASHRRQAVIVDVSAALPFGDEVNTVAADVHTPAGRPRAVLVCWPGGSYDRSYWDSPIEGYSATDHLVGQGFVVVNADHLGVGQSSKPSDIDGVNLETMAAANHAFAREVRRRLLSGEFDERLRKTEGDVPFVGVGHSLGGLICVIAQALHQTYDAVANLGYTHGSKDVIEDGEMGGFNDPAAPRRAAEEQAKAFFGGTWEAGYGVPPREPNHAWLYAPSVPPEVIDADDRTVAAWPRQAYVEGLIPGHTPPYAAKVKAPVLLAFGDHDIPARPRDDAAFYTAAADITVVTLPDSAHCHNFASTRHLMWDRLGGWAEGVASYLRSPTT
jgi:pimeloyl-ACP methyl ester carboxylesterase